MRDLAAERGLESLAERKTKHLHVLLIRLGVALRLGDRFGEENLGAAGQEGCAVDGAQRRVAGCDQTGLLRELPLRSFQRILTLVQSAGRHLPGPLLPGVPPPPHRTRLASVPLRYHKSRVR